MLFKKNPTAIFGAYWMLKIYVRLRSVLRHYSYTITVAKFQDGILDANELPDKERLYTRGFVNKMNCQGKNFWYSLPTLVCF